MSFPHITPIVSFRLPPSGGHSQACPPPPPPHLGCSLLHLWEVGEKKSLEIKRELLQQSPPITATSGDPEIFVSRRCIRMGKSRTDFCFQTLSRSKCLFRQTLMTDEGFQISRARGHRHRSRLWREAGKEGKKVFLIPTEK